MKNVEGAVAGEVQLGTDHRAGDVLIADVLFHLFMQAV